MHLLAGGISFLAVPVAEVNNRSLMTAQAVNVILEGMARFIICLG